MIEKPKRRYFLQAHVQLSALYTRRQIVGARSPDFEFQLKCGVHAKMPRRALSRQLFGAWKLMNQSIVNADGDHRVVNNAVHVRLFAAV